MAIISGDQWLEATISGTKTPNVNSMTAGWPQNMQRLAPSSIRQARSVESSERNLGGIWDIYLGPGKGWAASELSDQSSSVANRASRRVDDGHLTALRTYRIPEFASGFARDIGNLSSTERMRRRPIQFRGRSLADFVTASITGQPLYCDYHGGQYFPRGRIVLQSGRDVKYDNREASRVCAIRQLVAARLLSLAH